MIADLLEDWEPSALTRPFWAAIRAGELSIQRCANCGKFQHPPREFCTHCSSRAVSLTPVSGRGAIYTYTVVHRALIPALRDQVPYVLVVVALPEGPKVLSLLQECEPNDVRVGLEVRMVAREMTSDVALAVFRPV
jgi:uncharacterized OB-fold protein